MLSAWCHACQLGQHAYHEDEPRAPIHGLIGSGHRCPCRGECRTSPLTLAVRSKIKRTVEGAMAYPGDR